MQASRSLLALSLFVGGVALMAADKADRPKAKTEERIDFDRAKVLFQKKKAGEKLTSDEDAYLQKAIEARRGKDARGAAQSGVKSGETIGLKPLNEMTADDRYKDEDGGLYGNGRNTPPESHRKAAEAELAKIQPLNAVGKPAKDGQIVFVSISMSNATPRKGDALVWQRDDLDRDGTHPSPSGRQKVAQLLLDFYKNDALAKSWFSKSGRQ